MRFEDQSVGAVPLDPAYIMVMRRKTEMVGRGGGGWLGSSRPGFTRQPQGGNWADAEGAQLFKSCLCSGGSVLSVAYLTAESRKPRLPRPNYVKGQL